MRKTALCFPTWSDTKYVIYAGTVYRGEIRVYTVRLFRPVPEKNIFEGFLPYELRHEKNNPLFSYLVRHKIRHIRWFRGEIRIYTVRLFRPTLHKAGPLGRYSSKSTLLNFLLLRTRWYRVPCNYY